MQGEKHPREQGAKQPQDEEPEEIVHHEIQHDAENECFNIENAPGKFQGVIENSKYRCGSDGKDEFFLHGWDTSTMQASRACQCHRKMGKKGNHVPGDEARVILKKRGGGW